MTTYAQQRDEMQNAMATQAPAELLNGFSAAVARLDSVDFAARAPQVGEQAPDFVLPDHRGEIVSLSGLLATGPVVLIFYRGAWCPYCNLQLRTFQSRLSEFEAHGAQLVAISPQLPDNSLSMVERHELGFPVLSDVGASVIDRYGLRYEPDEELRRLFEMAGNDLEAFNGEGGWALPAAATFVITADGTVRFAHVTGDWTERPEPSAVLEALNEPAR